MVAQPAPLLGAASVLVDLADTEVLEQADQSTPVALDRALDLLLVAVVRERIAEGALTLTTRVPVLPVRGDRGPALAGRDQLPLVELLQLLLLVDSRTAARSLGAVAGPGDERLRSRMRRAALRLRLSSIAIPEHWPGPPPSTPRATGSAGHITAADLARLAAASWSEPEIRHRLALDGVPIADGAIIVRATAPLIALTPPPFAAPPNAARDALAGTPAAIASGSRDGLDLLAVASGPASEREVWNVLARGFERYERVTVVRSGQRVGREIVVRGGSIARFGAVAGEPFALTAPRGRRGARGVVDARLQLPAAVEPPIAVNQTVGELVLEQNGRIVAAIPLVAPLTIAPSGWFDTARR
jgi:D-alanyl-D-alanine carboxypeptidase